MGRTYSCWMLNCWCITWPVGFKRLNNVQTYIRYLSLIKNSTDQNLFWKLVITFLAKKVPIFYGTQIISVLKRTTCWTLPVDTSYNLRQSVTFRFAYQYFLLIFGHRDYYYYYYYYVDVALLLLYGLIYGDELHFYSYAVPSDDTTASACGSKTGISTFSIF